MSQPQIANFKKKEGIKHTAKSENMGSKQYVMPSREISLK